MKKEYYVLVADSAAAKLYRAENDLRELQLIHERVHPAGRKMPGELESDRAGQQRNTIGGMHSLAGDHDPQRHESEQFARALCQLLQQERENGRFTDLLIAAPPKFLGELRTHLSHECSKLLVKTVHKDLLRSDARDIAAHFA
ncbi:MAG: host attachment protein [Gammaproteobacteria bacterium]